MAFLHLTRQQWFVLVFTLVYTGGFGAYYASIADYEFLWYVAVLLFFFFLILGTIRYTHFTPVILWGLSLWGLLHMAGGGVQVGDGVLYGVQLIDITADGEMTIFKYDQLVHAYGFGVATLVAHHLLAPRWKDGASRGLLAALAALIGMGLGSVNEMVEFVAVLTFPETGVGGYINTALDLVFNALGAIGVALWLWLAQR